MEDRSGWPLTEPSDPATEIFNRLFKPDEDDMRWIQGHIDKHLKACRRYLRANPPRTIEALDEANEARMLAVAEGMVNIEPKIKFYKAECYRRLRRWKDAYRMYEECVVDAKDVYWLEAMRRFCKTQMLKPRKDPWLRRIECSENLQEEYKHDGIDEMTPFRQGW
ncbi:hypothetical protein M441DRAFT_150131 [Trichoderma asperellum CBS 433.97]|uniref:Uncharacterized protein n=1 Tax=Trichoderma asperellum (strain ATCC 204424 / CBS 433.97 / NBRC 101777) TaxID=1042311 RepID=A0A2T3YWD4_TRIA4|nr:hypothetical protein M441DRAFT_150131 [Trichoderma asperellum CBS 433.97]PTB36856.1 hypothetical protein M441DRAFT_150131 [Trichoderma asperellum CBS 433.97]